MKIPLHGGAVIPILASIRPPVRGSRNYRDVLGKSGNHPGYRVFPDDLLNGIDDIRLDLCHPREDASSRDGKVSIRDMGENVLVVRAFIPMNR